MEDQDKTEEQITGELENPRRRVSELEESESRLGGAERLLRETEERFAFGLDGAEMSFRVR